MKIGEDSLIQRGVTMPSVLSSSTDQDRSQSPASPDALKPRCAIVCMPWGSVAKPPIAPSILKGCVEAAGYTADLIYPSIWFAEQIGLTLYERISSCSFYQTEWFFSPELFGKKTAAGLRNSWQDLQDVPSAADLRCVLLEAVDGDEKLCQELADSIVPGFISSCMERVDWSRYTVVGFTTTFSQSLASLLLAKRIKEAHPVVKIVFGGSNVDGEMGVEYARSFHWVDFVVHGEAETAFPNLLRHIRDGEPAVSLPGITARVGDEISRGDVKANVTHNMDEVPVPDYSTYLREMEKAGLRKKIPLILYFEASRGCWWGAKHHCTFCGLNGSTMSYRRKSPNRVFDELMHLSSEYKCLQFFATDNILAHDYFVHLLPRLAELGSDIKLFFEVKANLTRNQVALMHASGINSIQPGIESFSTKLLKNMQKGVTAIQNVQLLKWCAEFKIRPGYNVLHGFPDETPEDYKDLATIFQKISHLQPPGSISALEFERFSPFFYDKERFGLTLTPKPDYDFIFPPDQVDLDRIAYFFSASFTRHGDTSENLAKAKAVWSDWKESWAKREIHCTVERGPDFLRIFDNRPRIAGSPPKPQMFHLGSKLTAIYLFCDENRSFRSILEMMRRRFSQEITPNQVQKWLDDLEFQWLIFREGDRYLSFATRRDGPWLAQEPQSRTQPVKKTVSDDLVQLA